MSPCRFEGDSKVRPGSLAVIGGGYPSSGGCVPICGWATRTFDRNVSGVARCEPLAERRLAPSFDSPRSEEESRCPPSRPLSTARSHAAACWPRPARRRSVGAAAPPQPGAGQGGGPAVRRSSLHARRRLGRSDADGVVLWTRLAPDPLARRRHAAAARARALGGRARPSMRRVVTPRRRASRDPTLGALACTSSVDGLAPGPRVLLPLRRRVAGEPDRPHAHAPARGRRLPSTRCGSRSSRARTGRTASTRAYRHMAARGPRPRRAPRRLHLRDGRADPAGAAAQHDGPEVSRAWRATATGTRCTRPTRPQAAHAAFRGSSPRTTTRSRTTTRTAIAGGRRTIPAQFLAAARRRLPRLLRAHAAAARVAAARAASCSSTAGLTLRRPRRVQRARHAPVPHRPAVRRRRQAALRGARSIRRRR